LYGLVGWIFYNYLVVYVPPQFFLYQKRADEPEQTESEESLAIFDLDRDFYLFGHGYCRVFDFGRYEHGAPVRPETCDWQ
jgi:hypothetical protein